MSLVTHVSSNHRCWYFHQPRPLMAKPGSHSSHWAQHSLDREKNKELFLAHFHVLRKSSDTKMREKIMPNFLPRAYFPVTCALVPGSHTGTGRVRVSSVSCPAHRTGKLILGLGSSCPNIFLWRCFCSPRIFEHPALNFYTASSSLRWKWGFLVNIFSGLLAPSLLAMPRVWMNHSLYWRWWEFQRMAMHCLSWTRAESATRGWSSGYTAG